MSYLRNSRKKIKQIIRQVQQDQSLDSLTEAQKKRLALWASVDSEKK